MRGRGSESQPVNRFTGVEFEPDPEYLEWLYQNGEERKFSTEVLDDQSRSVVSENKSPDLPFDFSLNPYRGCEHGCSYCYARPSHEYLGFAAGIDFETKIVAKPQAPELLKETLSKKSWQVPHLVMSGVTDPYQPVEKELEITRRCLQILSQFRQPIELITKNYLITRDLEYLETLASFRACTVRISITTLDPELGRTLEPRASAPQRRLQAVKALSQAGVPVGVNIAPVIPGLNDHEIPSLVQAAADSGARWVHYQALRLPGAVAPLFVSWLKRHRPNSEQKILRLIRELRGGKLNQSEFHTRFHGRGEVARRLRQLFDLSRRKVGLSTHPPELSGRHFEVPGPKQLKLF